MKIIPYQEIENCVYCPYYSTKDYEDPYCGHDSGNRCFTDTELDAMDNAPDERFVPDWCTLEEVGK